MLLNEAKECQHFNELSDTINPYTGFTVLASHLILVSVIFFYFMCRKVAEGLQLNSRTSLHCY